MAEGCGTGTRCAMVSDPLAEQGSSSLLVVFLKTVLSGQELVL